MSYDVSSPSGAGERAPRGQGTSLAPLLSLVNRDPVLAGLAIGAERSVAVAEAAQPFAVAAVAQSGARRPVVVAVPSGTTADRLAHEIGAWIGPSEVALFPAWETLPFERVSPAAETMGRRLELMWRLRRLRDGATAAEAGVPSVIVSPVRALLQRLGPHVEDTEPVQVSRGALVDLDELVERLAYLGYRREYQVEHRGELAVRGSIVDVFPSTAVSPVRIDLWGDEVDRLTQFSVADQRSVADLEDVLIFGCRELLPSPEVRQRAASLAETEKWGSETWERLAEGLTFDGMESWLPWLTADEHLLVDLLPEGAKVLLVEPRRMRERAIEIAEEEADLAGALATTWGAEGRDFPRLYLPFDRLLSGTGASVATLTFLTRRPRHPVGQHDRLGPGRRRHRTSARPRSATPPAKKLPSWFAPKTKPSAERLSKSLRDEGFIAPVASEVGGDMQVVVTPIDRGFIYPALELAVLAEERRHRSSPPPPGAPAAGRASSDVLRRHENRRLRRAFPARCGSLRRHGEAVDRRRRHATTWCSSTATATSFTCPRTRWTPYGRTRAAKPRPFPG